MPGNLISTDVQIPALTGDTQRDIQMLYDMLHQLTDMIQYSLRNLKRQNFNEADFKKLLEETMGR